MARARSARRGVLDPFAQTIRQTYVAHRDAHLAQWWTRENEAHWQAERAQWTSGEAMIMGSGGVFDALTFAGLDREAQRFAFATDRDESRRWLIPGSEGGPVAEVEWRASDWYTLGTDRLAPGGRS